MSETCQQSSDQRAADLMTLHRQLQEMSARRKSASRESSQNPDRIHGPTLVIRGK